MAEKKDNEIKKAKDLVEEKLNKKKPAAAKKKEAKKEKAKKPKAESGQKAQDPPADAEAMKLTFYSYLIMLGSIGWQFLGKIPNPQTGKVEKNLMRVKEIISLMEILEEKTKGNLSDEENNILKSTLSNLRLNYVDELKK